MNGTETEKETLVFFFLWYFWFSFFFLAPAAYWFWAEEEDERGTNTNKETNIKTADLKGAAALANELRQRAKKREERKKRGAGRRDSEETRWEVRTRKKLQKKYAKRQSNYKILKSLGLTITAKKIIVSNNKTQSSRKKTLKPSFICLQQWEEQQWSHVLKKERNYVNKEPKRWRHLVTYWV